MALLYIDTGGTATNSGSTDQNAANLSGIGDAVVTGLVVQLTIGTNLSGVDATAGSATQSTIYIAQATNANQKIFWITAKDDALDRVTVSVAPTGVTASDWAIGGRYAAPAGNGLNLIDGAFRPGDNVQVNNSPAAATVDWVTGRVAGTSAGGFIKIYGVIGTRPVINVTNTTQVLEGGSQSLWWLENIEAQQNGASGNVFANFGAGSVAYNVKISDGGGAGINVNAAGARIIASEVSGVTGDCITLGANSGFICGTNLHDGASNGVSSSMVASNSSIVNNVIDTCAGRGILDTGAATSAAHMLNIRGNTVYGCGDSGLEITDADRVVSLTNNIFSENGNAAGEYNVEWVAGSAEMCSFHSHNIFYHSGGGGGANLSGLTVNAQVASSEVTTDPLFTNAASGDFSIGSTSPAKATGFPGQFLGGSLGYLDIGAVQRQEAGGSGGGMRLAGHGGLASGA